VNTDNSDTHYRQYGQHSVARIKGAGEKKDEKDKEYYPLGPGADDSHVLRIALVKGSAGQAHLLNPFYPS
jgi:hypothetical protein